MVEIIKKITETKEQQINERKRNWNKQVKDFPSPYQYLNNNIQVIKNNIHKYKP